jgi:hypothetical protein
MRRKPLEVTDTSQAVGSTTKNSLGQGSGLLAARRYRQPTNFRMWDDDVAAAADQATDDPVAGNPAPASWPAAGRSGVQV